MISEHNNFALEVVFMPKENQKKLQLQFKHQKTGVIYGNWDFIPYLTLQENLFLGIPKKKQNPLSLRKILKDIGVASEILPLMEINLSRYDKIRLQLIHQLLNQPEKIILVDVTFGLTVKETQDLLHLLEQVAGHHQLKLELITSDLHLAKALGEVC